MTVNLIFWDFGLFGLNKMSPCALDTVMNIFTENNYLRNYIARLMMNNIIIIIIIVSYNQIHFF